MVIKSLVSAVILSWPTTRRIGFCLFLAIGRLSAVPLEQFISFDEQLDPLHWNIKGSDVLPHTSKGLLLIPAASQERVDLTYRYYPIRRMADRYAFGPFSARLEIAEMSQGARVVFGLYDAASDNSWNLGYANGASVEVWSEIKGVRQEFSASNINGDVTPIILEWIWTGKVLEACIEKQGVVTPIATWEGTIPAIANFNIQFQPEQSGATLKVDSLKIAPLFPRIGSHRILPRPGIPLPGDEALPPELSPASYSLGGVARGGYLWRPNDEAELQVEVSNFTSQPQVFRLQTCIRVLEGRGVFSEDQNLEISGASDENISIKLPSNTCGFFTVETSLYDADGALVGAPQYTDYAITAAVDASQLNGDSLMGVHAYPYADLGAKWVRFWDNGSPLLWSKLEPHKGQWQWPAADAYINRTIAAGMRPLVVLAATPEWASSDTSYTKYIGRGSYSPPKNIEDWKRYCREVASRYKGKAEYFEIWNEPNNNKLAERGFFFYGSAEEYFEILKAAYEAIKEVNPNAVVMGPSGTGNFFPFLRRLLELGAGDYLDVISIHTYTTPFPPEIGYHFNQEKSYRYRVERVRELMAEFGVDKPIWNTEVGFSDAPVIAGRRMNSHEIADEAQPGVWPNWKKGWSFRPVDERRTAAFRVRFLIQSAALDIEKIFYHHRLIQKPETEPHISAPALAFANKLFSGSEFDQAWDVSPQCEFLGFKLKDGRYLLTFWRVEEETLFMETNMSEPLSLQIDSAPVDWDPKEQQGLTAHVSTTVPQSRQYFEPERLVPGMVSFEQAVSGYDFFGNEVSPKRIWPIDEAPSYVILKQAPDANLSFTIIDRIASASSSEAAQEPVSGTWSPGGSVLRNESVQVDQIYPEAVRLPLKDALAENKETQVVSNSEIVLGQVLLDLPRQIDGRGRLLLEVRTNSRYSPQHSFRYTLIADDRVNLPLSEWGGMPVRESSKGSNWSIMRGAVISPVVEATASLRIESSKKQGRIYAAWWLPEL